MSLFRIKHSWSYLERTKNMFLVPTLVIPKKKKTNHIKSNLNKEDAVKTYFVYIVKKLHNATSMGIIIAKERSRDLIAGHRNGINRGSMEESVDTTGGIRTVCIRVIVIGHIRRIFIERGKMAIT